MEHFNCGRILSLHLLISLTFTVVLVKSSKMKLTGEITFTAKGQEEQTITLEEGSHLVVKFEDVSVMDVPSTLLGKQEQLLPKGTKLGSGAEALNYTIVCDAPEHKPVMASVSAVINNGWKASGNDWIRKNDFFSDTTHYVDMSGDSDHFITDIKLVQY